MIRREILDNPGEVIRTFDFSDDFRDTSSWLNSIGDSRAFDIRNQLSVAFDNWWEVKHRKEARETPAGKLLVRYGFEPYDTESSARAVAEKAAEEIETLVQALERCAGDFEELNRPMEAARIELLLTKIRT